MGVVAMGLVGVFAFVGAVVLVRVFVACVVATGFRRRRGLLGCRGGRPEDGERQQEQRGRDRTAGGRFGQLTIRFGFMPEQPSCLAAVEQRPV